MATVKKVTVTAASVVTNDTLAGYNIYSNQDGKLNTSVVAPATAAAGVDYSLTDGVVHNITAKPVGTINGEFTAVSSSAVSVDLTGAGAPVVTFGEVGTINATTVVLTANETLEVMNVAGANGFTIDNSTEGTAITVTNVQVQLSDPTKIILTVTAGLKDSSEGIVSVDYIGTAVEGTDGNPLASISNLTLVNNIPPPALELFNFINAASAPDEANSNTGFSAATLVHTEIIGSPTVTPQHGARFLEVKSANAALGGGDTFTLAANLLTAIPQAGDLYTLSCKYFIPTSNTDTGQKIIGTVANINESGTMMADFDLTLSGAKGAWHTASLANLRIASKGTDIRFQFRGGAASVVNQPVYYDEIKLTKTHQASSLFNTYSATEAGGKNRVGTLTYTWTGSVGVLSAITDSNGPGATAGETYLQWLDTGATFNTGRTLSLGSGTRLIKCKIKISGTGNFRIGGRRRLAAADYATWQDVEFVSANGFQFATLQAANGTTLFISDIEMGTVIDTAL
jgi:hypothetical protein